MPFSSDQLFPLPRVQMAFRQWLLRHEREFDHDVLRSLQLAWIGVFFLPLYYFIWTRVFPQRYESALLRVAAFLMFALLIASVRRLPPNGRVALAFVTVTFGVTFNLTYMNLMNAGAPAWSEATLIGVIILFHFELRWAIASYLIGTVLGAYVFVMVGDPAVLTSPAVLGQLPLDLLAIFVVSGAKVGQRMLSQEKLSGMAHALGAVAHELRTPLASVEANLRGLRRVTQRGGGTDPAVLDEALARISFETRHMNHLVDLFLMSATAVQRRLEPTESVSVREAAQSVLQRYPFTSHAQRDSVSIEVRRDFQFPGQRELCTVVLLNLLRNALHALHRAGKGSVRIVVDGSHTPPRLLVIDTGCGIAPAHLPNIFKRFYTFPASAGSGMGLAMCKEILHAWNASIRCISREGAYTMFVLEFPEGSAAPVHSVPAIEETSPCACPSTSIPA